MSRCTECVARLRGVLSDRINNQLQVITMDRLSPESVAAVQEIGRLVRTFSLEGTQEWVTKYSGSGALA